MKIGKLLIIALLQFVMLDAGTITIKNGPGPQSNAWQIYFVDSSGQKSSPYLIPKPNSSITYNVSDSVTKCHVWRGDASIDFPCEPNSTYQLITQQTDILFRGQQGVYLQTIVGASEVTP